ncbi:Phospholipase A2 [Caenorhabditis elegans]|uniref:Phospholipase A2 n=1 Tax=Caenorhabditis elegans TaxID=6239 RepID=O16654_CAEEL|nr:Phospholipase A2 [Caenorhabditis elegans]CCD62825.2 Phospholipase A2 [Caenorhabditis elegans]|eukprot:NP_493719.3 Phospholipase A(2) [Caenorhabditis elegans]
MFLFPLVLGFLLPETLNTFVLEIQFMTRCMTHHDAWIYNGYGCYCGIGGSGDILDDIDECCANHDKCYEDLDLKKTCWTTPFEYFPIYSWKCQNQTIHCDTLSEASDHPVLAHECSNQLCECDRKLVECWAKYPEPTGQLKCPHPRLSRFLLKLQKKMLS